MNADDNSLYVIVLKGKPCCEECMKDSISITKLSLPSKNSNTFKYQVEQASGSKIGSLQEIKKASNSSAAEASPKASVKDSGFDVIPILKKNIAKANDDAPKRNGNVPDKEPINRKAYEERTAEPNIGKSNVLNMVKSVDFAKTQKPMAGDWNYKSEPSLSSSNDDHDFKVLDDLNLSALSLARMLSDSKSFRDDVSVSSSESDVEPTRKPYTITSEDEAEIEKEEIEEGKFRVTHWYSVVYLVINFALWFVCFSTSVFFSFSDSFYDYDRGSAESYYKYTAAAFFLSSAYCLYAHFTTKGRNKKRYLLIMSMVNLVSFTTYLAIAFKLGYPLVDPLTDTPIDAARFIEWTFSCPVIILISMELCQGKLYILPTIAVDYSAYIFGLSGLINEAPYRIPLLSLAYLAILFVFYQLAAAYDEAIASRKPEIPRNNLRFLKWQTLLCWSMFAVTHMLFNTGLIEYEQAEAFYCLSDFVAKFLFSLVLVTSSQKTQKLQ